MINYLTLSNSVRIPSMGLGTFGIKPQDVNSIVTKALSLGYRYFDCAWVYRNETEIGEVLDNDIKSGRVKRKDLFISSKLWSAYHRPELIKVGFQESLKNLRQDYLDLFLVHWPISIKPGMRWKMDSKNLDVAEDIDLAEIWKGMEKLVDSGKVRSIGISNYNVSQIQHVLDHCRIKPVVHQIESHAYFPNKTVIEFCERNGIQVVAYSPLGSPEMISYENEVFKKPLDDAKVKMIARKLNATPGQILLSYILRRNLACVPKTSSCERLEENIKASEIILPDEDFNTLDNLNVHTRFIWTKMFQYAPKYPFTDELEKPIDFTIDSFNFSK